MDKPVEPGAKAGFPGKPLGRPGYRGGSRPAGFGLAKGAATRSVAAPLASLCVVRRPGTYERQDYLPLAASLSFEPAETFTL
ncbi:hypothetical protein SHIRM173S_08146 [Streptomyces hirsutus]